MKKLFLLGTLSFLMVMSAFAQKNHIKTLKEQKQKYFGKTQKDFSRAAYLQDSSKIFFIDSGDSSVFLSTKYKYNPNGTTKVEDTYIDFLGLFQIYDRTENFYNSAKPLQKAYSKLNISEDGVIYELYSRDTFFYDSKDRLSLERSRFALDNSVLSYTTYQYKTNFATADTIRNFEYDENLDDVIPYEFTYNTLDAKGNITQSILSEIDGVTDEFGPSSKDNFVYNNQNQVTEQLSSTWDTDNSKWLKSSLTKIFYQPNGDVKHTIELGDFTDPNNWGRKDSTFYVYGANGKIKTTLYYSFDDPIPGSYFLSSKQEFVYDNNGNNTYVASFEKDENDPTLFVKSLSIRNWWSFFKDAVGIKEIFSKDFQIVSANPLSDNQSININSKADGEYVLTAYNTSGAVVSRQVVKGNQSVTPQLPSSGTYIFLLSDKNNNLLTMKKIVKM